MRRSRTILVTFVCTLILCGGFGSGQGRESLKSVTCTFTRSDRPQEFIAPADRIAELIARLERSGFACELPKALPTTK